MSAGGKFRWMATCSTMYPRRYSKLREYPRDAGWAVSDSKTKHLNGETSSQLYKLRWIKCGTINPKVDMGWPLPKSQSCFPGTSIWVQIKDVTRCRWGVKIWALFAKVHRCPVCHPWMQHKGFAMLRNSFNRTFCVPVLGLWYPTWIHQFQHTYPRTWPPNVSMG